MTTPVQGSLFAEMFAMLVLAIRLPIVVVVSAPVLLDLLTGPCFLDSKSHSLLMNCGQEIFSLEEFFNAAYACNGHFWRILAKAGNFLSPGFAQTFLNGMTAVGENSGASAFMPGLIGAFSKVSENNPTDSLSGTQAYTQTHTHILANTCAHTHLQLSVAGLAAMVLCQVM